MHTTDMSSIKQNRTYARSHCIRLVFQGLHFGSYYHALRTLAMQNVVPHRPEKVVRIVEAATVSVGNNAHS
jgi:hypothetical protein